MYGFLVLSFSALTIVLNEDLGLEKVSGSRLAMLTVPRPEGFIDPRVWITRCLFRSELFLHTFHPRAKTIATRTTFWLGSLEAGLAGVCFVIRSAPLCVQTALRVLTFLALPRWRLSHITSPFEQPAYYQQGLGKDARPSSLPPLLRLFAKGLGVLVYQFPWAVVCSRRP